jgi:glutamine synthetase
LVPCAIYNDPIRKSTGVEINILVLCDCYNKDGIPIDTNTRYRANEIFKQVKNQYPWYGLEQEYFLYDLNTGKPLGWPVNGEPEAQGKYYCGVGANNVYGRHIIEEHYAFCLKAGLQISGINAEVVLGQWEYQIGPCVGIEAGDQLWMARYILLRVCEKYNVKVRIDSKPIIGDWNGSGCHANYSTVKMRNDGGIIEINSAIEKLSKAHMEHIEVYGNNENRLIGTHETSNMVNFTSGIGDRTASIRIPTQTAKNGKGYLEDRRPSSDSDPYLVTAIIAKTTLL